ncbi:MAG: DinB family protein [Flavipsychrobacter sp.]|nr:DinB family protein [Flavipsychrobacter sp.]
MNYNYIITNLQRNKAVFHSLLAGLTEEEYLWKQQPEKWCLLEIICHLYDEEREDFRARTKHTLETPELPMSPIDPVGWVKERKYLEQDYEAKLTSFLQERDNSIAWLKSLNDPNWDNTYHHPKLGALTAKMFLCNWLAHDHLHIRQITRLKYDHLKHLSGESLSYAGDW